MGTNFLSGGMKMKSVWSGMKKIGAGLMLLSVPALGCGGTVNGVIMECGNNWIRWKSTTASFDQYHGFGSGWHVRQPQIQPGCWVYGPYADAPFAGQLSGYIKIEALVDVASVTVHNPFGGTINLLNSGDAMFTMDMTANSGQTVLASKTITYGQMTTWTGNSTPWSRCTAADPCTAGGPGHKVRTFRMYRNTVNLDMFGRNITGPMNGIEVRVCNLNPRLTSAKAYESEVQLAY